MAFILQSASGDLKATLSEEEARGVLRARILEELGVTEEQSGKWRWEKREAALYVYIDGESLIDGYIMARVTERTDCEIHSFSH